MLGRTYYLLIVVIFVLLTPSNLVSQQFTRAEIGFTTSTLPGNRWTTATDVGLGGRFTYNFSPSFAIESEIDSYLTHIHGGQRWLQFGGRANLAVLGAKAGIRKRDYGLFLKVRPGVLSFGNAAVYGSSSATKRITHAALDLGVASEFYPTARTILRVDIGTLLVRYGDAKLFSSPTGVSISSIGWVDPPWHIAVAAEYRLGRLRNEEESSPLLRRFQVGGQYSLLTLQRSAQTVRDESGIGGWANWNFNKYLGLDGSVLFFPRLVRFADFQQGGRIVQALAGVRSGIRRGHIGVFGKFRPGVQIYTATSQNLTVPGVTSFTDLAFDVGGLIEVYTSRHTLLRFDAGKTIVYYRGRGIIAPNGAPLYVPAFSRSTIQLTSGFGFRF
jgi:hypothetical protein